MDILADIVGEILEEVFSALITSTKIPKIIRYLLVAVVAAFVIVIGLLLTIRSGNLPCSLVGMALIALGIAAGSILAVRIHRN